MHSSVFSPTSVVFDLLHNSRVCQSLRTTRDELFDIHMDQSRMHGRRTCLSCQAIHHRPYKNWITRYKVRCLLLFMLILFSFGWRDVFHSQESSTTPPYPFANQFKQVYSGIYRLRKEYFDNAIVWSLGFELEWDFPFWMATADWHLCYNDSGCNLSYLTSGHYKVH